MACNRINTVGLRVYILSAFGDQLKKKANSSLNFDIPKSNYGRKVLERYLMPDSGFQVALKFLKNPNFFRPPLISLKKKHSKKKGQIPKKAHIF